MWKIMKKRLVFIFFCLIASYLFAERIDWKGKEMGMKPNPAWLSTYLKKNEEKNIRRKFDIDKNAVIFYAISEDLSLENAKYTAEMDCRKKVLEYLKESNKNRDVINVSGMERVTDYWEKDSDGTYKFYVFYTIAR